MIRTRLTLHRPLYEALQHEIAQRKLPVRIEPRLAFKGENEEDQVDVTIERPENFDTNRLFSEVVNKIYGLTDKIQQT
ncbi:MAG: hypothetical protein Q4D56_06565 [Bacteroides sp.]|nr:hypothetical protein [Bacteroides sp.]